MSGLTKVCIGVLAAACGGLGIVWKQSLGAPPSAVLGEWKSAFYNSEPQSTLLIRADGTYLFKTIRGRWHMDGDQIILEAFSDSYDEVLSLTDDGKTLTDGTVDGTTFVR